MCAYLCVSGRQLETFGDIWRHSGGYSVTMLQAIVNTTRGVKMRCEAGVMLDREGDRERRREGAGRLDSYDVMCWLRAGDVQLLEEGSAVNIGYTQWYI